MNKLNSALNKLNKNFIWKKQGLIYNIPNNGELFKSHAQIPTALFLPKLYIIRVYYATRTFDNQSNVTFIDVDYRDPSKILYIHDKPILNLGRSGLFDEHGIMPNSVIKKDGLVYLYYIGWSRRESIPYCNFGGLAISKDNGVTFEKVSLAPVLDRTEDDLYAAGICDVRFENNLWQALYVSGIDWIKINDNFEQTYSIKYASSFDGINWFRKKEFIIDQLHPMEAITRPTVIKNKDIYHMWFCYRESVDYRNGSGSYKIGYAWSKDYINWNRHDDRAGIKVSKDDWDSLMQAYPNVIKVENKYYMFYNGNGFGKSGFGYAELEF